MIGPAVFAPRIALAALVLVIAPLAASAAPWSVKGRGTRVVAEVTSTVKGGRLTLSCEESVKLYVYPPAAWDGRRYDKAKLLIDGVEVAVTVDPVDRGVILSDMPESGVGTTVGLRSRLKRGQTLVVSGLPTADIPPAQLTFPLSDAAPAIATFERQCPAGRALR